eukprot:496883-Lingulodinium_polyedra.AAC.1
MVLVIGAGVAAARLRGVRPRYLLRGSGSCLRPAAGFAEERGDLPGAAEDAMPLALSASERTLLNDLGMAS